MNTATSTNVRETRIFHAIKTSFWSKGSTLILQFVSLPLVAREMGPEMFGIYATVSALIGAASVLDLGIGPALARKITFGVTAGDKAQQAYYFRAATVIVLAIGWAILAAGASLLLTGRVIRLFGSKYQSHESLLQTSCLVVVVLLFLQIVTSLGVKARAGFQEIHLNNTFATVGNLGVAIFLLSALWIRPSVLSVLLIVYGAGLVAQMGNLAHLLWFRPYLLQKTHGSPLTPAIKQLLTDGIFYAVAVGLLSSQRELGKIFLARLEGPSVVGDFSILTNILNMAGGFLVMFTAAIWPAITDAETRGDNVWLSKLWRKLSRLSALYAVGLGLVIAIGGGVFVRLFYGKEHAMSGLTFVLLGLYFGILVIGHVRFTWLLGQGRMGLLAKVTLLEFLFNMLAMVLLNQWLSIEVLLAIFTVNHFAFSVLLQAKLSGQVFNDAVEKGNNLS